MSQNMGQSQHDRRADLHKLKKQEKFILNKVCYMRQEWRNTCDS